MPRRNRSARRRAVAHLHHGRRHERQTARTCPTGKVRYRDKAEALAALQRITAGSKRAKVARRAFGCSLCGGGWHLTSQAKRDPTVAPPR